MHTAEGQAVRSAESFAAHVVYKTTVWNKTEAGREATRRHNATRDEKNRQKALIKSGGIVVMKPGEFDASSVQKSLTNWGGS